MSPLALMLIGAGVILVYAAFKDKSPVAIVTNALQGTTS